LHDRISCNRAFIPYNYAEVSDIEQTHHIVCCDRITTQLTIQYRTTHPVVNTRNTINELLKACVMNNNRRDAPTLAEHDHMTLTDLLLHAGGLIARYPAMAVTAFVGVCSAGLWNPGTPWHQGAVWLIVALVVYTAIDTIHEMIVAFRKGRVGVDLLALLSIASTAMVGEYWAAWLVCLMIRTGEMIEIYAQRRAQESLTALVDAAPATANVVTRTGNDLLSSPWQVRQIDQVKVGDVLIVRPGETVPSDGELLSDRATLDMSAINGESMPVHVGKAGHVLSGSINGEMALAMRVATPPNESQYQRILDLVKTARESRAPIVRTADTLAIPFTILSLILAGAAWALTGNPVRFPQVLVLATPCPLLIAAPVAYMGGTGRLARSSIIIKRQEILEVLGKVTHIFFDKTGTLTSKQPQVTRVELAEGFEHTDSTWILCAAGALESNSVHILAKGIVSAAERTGKETLLATDIREQPGQGVQGVVDGKTVCVGRAEFVVGNGLSLPGKSDEWSQQSRSQWNKWDKAALNEMAAYVSIDGTPAARIILRDVPRPAARASIERLRVLGIHKITMLTGDHMDSAQIVAKEVGIQDVRASLLPEDKFAAVHANRAEQSETDVKHHAEITMMVGDGVNDAPVLAAANVGIAMTDGSSTAASQSSQVVIMNDDIGGVPSAVEIARMTRKIMLQAVVGGLVVATACMVLAAFGLISVVLGALIQEGIDAASILWSLRTAFISQKTLQVVR
jgi:heavy metal translocating P-type ATPase